MCACVLCACVHACARTHRVPVDEGLGGWAVESVVHDEQVPHDVDDGGEDEGDEQVDVQPDAMLHPKGPAKNTLICQQERTHRTWPACEPQIQVSTKQSAGSFSRDVRDNVPRISKFVVPALSERVVEIGKCVQIVACVCTRSGDNDMRLDNCGKCSLLCIFFRLFESFEADPHPRPKEEPELFQHVAADFGSQQSHLKTNIHCDRECLRSESKAEQISACLSCRLRRNQSNSILP